MRNGRNFIYLMSIEIFPIREANKTVYQEKIIWHKGRVVGYVHIDMED